MYEYSGDPEIREAAEVMTARIAGQQFVTSHINCSFGDGYRLTGRKDYWQALIDGCNSLASRFDPKVGLARSWDPGVCSGEYIVIIDNMMNLELLTVSSSLSGDNRYYDMVCSHADLTRKNYFWSDGSNFHLDFYNSFIIQPMLLWVLERVAVRMDDPSAEEFLAMHRLRYTQLAAHLERMTSLEGTYPVLGTG